MPSDRERLISLIETNLFTIAKDPGITREEAERVRSMLTRPLGIINSRFDFATNSSHVLKKRLTQAAKTD